MRIFYPFPVSEPALFRKKLLQFSHTAEHFCYLDSNNYQGYPYSTFGAFFAIEALHSISVNKNCLEQLEAFRQKHHDWMFGFLSYDLKNEIEADLVSAHADGLQNPLVHFFIPRYLVKIENGQVEIGLCCNEEDREQELKRFQNLVNSTILPETGHKKTSPEIKSRTSKQKYIQTVEKIKDHIRSGDIYELNYCQEFYSEAISVDAVSVFEKLNDISRAPFSCFMRNEKNYLMCASPERYLKRVQNKLISQPIKGTRKRAMSEAQDKRLQEELYSDEKERSENVMIVDLVRNDLSRIALQNSVQVDELFGIYTFEQVHQMISTITCSILPQTGFKEIIENTFPMGSMTGAPKISAMQFIEKFEDVRRGLYSGAVGYITPKGNFDFNVVIRSILYNAEEKYISMQAGSAITIDCDAEKEYEECLLKARAMMEALS